MCDVCVRVCACVCLFARVCVCGCAYARLCVCTYIVYCYSYVQSQFDDAMELAGREFVEKITYYSEVTWSKRIDPSGMSGASKPKLIYLP